MYLVTQTYRHKGPPVTKVHQLEERKRRIALGQILKMFYICPFMGQAFSATNDFQVSWNPFLYNVLKRAIWMGKFQVESNSV